MAVFRPMGCSVYLNMKHRFQEVKIMQKGGRREIINLLASIKSVRQRYVYLEKTIVPLSSQAEYERTLQHYDHLITALTEDVKAQPIGYKYTGTYYLKKPYALPVEFEKCSGTLFMREDLVSWQIEKGPGSYDYTYYRAVFKKPHGEQIKREDGEPIFKH